jgi:hypothetical protein
MFKIKARAEEKASAMSQLIHPINFIDRRKFFRPELKRDLVIERN